MPLAPGRAKILEVAVSAIVPLIAWIGGEEAGADAFGDGADDRCEGVKHLVESSRFSWGPGHKFPILGHKPVGDQHVDTVAQQLTGGETVNGQLQAFAPLDRVFVHVLVVVRLTRLVVEHKAGIAGR